MGKAIRVHKAGGPEELQWEDVSVSEPGEGEVRIKHTVVGLNFIDIYFRKAIYPPPGYPFTPGMEAAAVVTAVGPGLTGCKVGDRVAYAGRPIGAYSEERVIPADVLVPLPDNIPDELAAASLLKGMTAHILLRRVFKVEKGHRILVHAAAGGVGSILVQWAHSLGATVIGTAGSEEKIALVKELGADHVINYKTQDFVQEVKKLTNGAGVNVVYDSVGKDTFTGSLDCLAPLGTLAVFGASSGAPEPFSLAELARRGSLFVTRPSLMDYTKSREELLTSAGELFQMLAGGLVKVTVGNRFPLAEAQKAHEALEGRHTTGSSVLVP